MVAIEDQRFYEHKGVDYQGIARALWQDVRRQRAAQGGSTITQQFVKNALVAQKNRSVFQKLKEAALAYQLERKWTKDKILTQYLNTVYFGEGAYGIESAARVYFGWIHPGCEPHCAAVLDPAEAALLAGHDRLARRVQPGPEPGRRAAAPQPRARPHARPGLPHRRREYDAGSARRRCRRASQISRAAQDQQVPYFTSWVEQQLVDRYGTGDTFGGGLRIRTTLDLDYQQAAEQAIAGASPGSGRARRSSRSTTRPAASARWSAARTSRRARSTSPPRATASRARRSSRSRSSRRSRRASRPGGRSSRRRRRSTGRAATSRSRTTRTVTRGVDLAGQRDHRLRQLRLRRGRIQVRRHPSGRRSAKQMGISTPLSSNPAMVLGGLRIGRDAARDGPLLCDARPAAATASRARSRPTTTGRSPTPRSKAGGIDDENDQGKRVVPEGVASRPPRSFRPSSLGGTGRERRRSASSPPARPAPRRTTRTPGSSASTTR